MLRSVNFSNKAEQLSCLRDLLMPIEVAGERRHVEGFEVIILRHPNKEQVAPLKLDRWLSGRDKDGPRGFEITRQDLFKARILP